MHPQMVKWFPQYISAKEAYNLLKSSEEKSPSSQMFDYCEAWSSSDLKIGKLAA